MKKEFLSPSELAKACGVSTDTLRHYERKGVLPAPARLQNGYRRYPAQSLDRVLMIRRALSIGFTLDELARILKVRDRGGAPCRQVRELAASRLSEIEDQLREMIDMRDELRGILRDWDARLAQRAAGERGGLLESLGARPPARADLSPLRRPVNKKLKKKGTEHD